MTSFVFFYQINLAILSGLKIFIYMAKALLTGAPLKMRHTPLHGCVESKHRLSLNTSQVAHQAGAYPGFSRIKRLAISILPPG